MLAEYTYVKGNVVVRVDKDMAPSDAKAYEDALDKIAGGGGGPGAARGRVGCASGSRTPVVLRMSSVGHAYVI